MRGLILSVPKYKARLPSNLRLRRHGVGVNGPRVPFARTSWTVAQRTGESNPSGGFQPSNAWQACPVPLWECPPKHRLPNRDSMRDET